MKRGPPRQHRHHSHQSHPHLPNRRLHRRHHRLHRPIHHLLLLMIEKVIVKEHCTVQAVAVVVVGLVLPRSQLSQLPQVSSEAVVASAPFRWMVAPKMIPMKQTQQDSLYCRRGRYHYLVLPRRLHLVWIAVSTSEVARCVSFCRFLLLTSLGGIHTP